MIEPVFKEFNPEKKDKVWFKRVLDELRNRKLFLCDPRRYEYNQTFAEGKYDTSHLRKLYDTTNQPASELNIDFDPIDILGNRINSIISMIEKQGFMPKAQTTDPTARDKKDADIELLKAEKELEPVRMKMAQAMGLKKPLPIASEEDFSSDVSPVNDLNLDINNSVDEGIFKNYLQRQVWEIALEVGMEHYLNQNEYNEKFKLILADLINHNCCATQVVTNSYSGEAWLSYLYPHNVYTIFAKQNDGKDAIGKGWEKSVSVRDVIGLMGKDITADNLDSLLQLANTAAGTTYPSIWFSWDRVDPTGISGFSYPQMGLEQGRCCDWAAFLNMNVILGYLEIKSQNSDLYIHRIVGGNLNTDKESYDYKPPKNIRKVNSIDDLERDSDRFLEYKFYDVTYKGFYLPTLNTVFGFGKLPLAVRFGTKNELTDFSISTQKIKGKSMTEKCIPFIKHIMSLWVKAQYFVNESRPSGESWDIDVVRELSQLILGTTAEQSKIMETLKVLQNNTNTVHRTVKVVGGQPIGGDGDPVKQRIRGLDPTIPQMYDLIREDKNQIIEITGVSDVLLATSSVQGGLGVSQIALQQSLNTIYYIQSAAQKLFSDICFNISHKIQLIVNGSKTTEAYISIVKAIGERNVKSIKLLGDNPPYSFSIFIEWGMNQIQREQVDKLTELLVQAKSITAAQAFQIKAVKSWKLAGALLSFFETKSLQQQQAAITQQQQAEAAAEAQKHQYKMEEIAAEGQNLANQENIRGQFVIQGKQIDAQNKSEVQSQRDTAKIIHSAQDQEHNIERMHTENQFENQNPQL